VVISLDASSNITSARVVRSPSELLNEPALDAARHSVFRTEIRDCRPVARDFLFIVTFHG
ncbi:MAG: hypothetical protein JOZ24_02330, partial [Candidatus Eremiobacteraeota bacterium]|nr:hypothetical protein [Candidatus Eremiobacteraeota bacterium]